MRRFLATALLLAAPTLASAAPQIDVTVDAREGENGWYTSDVRLLWTVTGAVTVSGDCSAAQSQTVITDETPFAAYRCDAWDDKGFHAVLEAPVKLDKTPPAVHALPERPPDHAGWYTRPLTIRFSGSDATSGIEACTTAGYAGPDSPAAAITGTCRDRAGLVGSATAQIAYDVTAPAVEGLAVGAGDTRADLRWQPSADAVEYSVTRSPGRRGEAATVVYRGPQPRYADARLRNGVRYAYTVAALDAAGNLGTATATARPSGRLLAPAPGARLRRPPVLRWKRSRRAAYYNVQLFRGERKVLSAWPVRPHLRLARAWVYAGHRFRLRRGTYRWYVFPGFGARSARRYGPALGTRTFRMR